MVLWCLMVGLGHAADTGADLSTAFAEAAADFSVPEPVLLALAYEASRWQPDVASQWGGYGLFDFREPGEHGPDIEQAAMLLAISPDEIMASPTQQIRAAAALLAWSAQLGDTPLPPATDLAAWSGAVRSFSARQAPNLQQMYVEYIYTLLEEGIPADDQGLSVAAHDIERLPLDSPPPPPGTCDYAGCYQFIAASSSNYSDYSRGPDDIQYIVVHTVQGSYSGCISWFQNSTANVSAHYVVRSSDGQVTQMVREEDVAWHAGNWDYNLASVGIEHEGYIDEPAAWYTDAMYGASGVLSADIVARNNIPISRSYIIAHHEVPGATHTDPGSGWDWDAYLDAIAGGSGTGSLLGVVAAEDIYNGPRLTDATVWIAETGETAAVDADGQYRFDDMPLASVTVHAAADGYMEGTCTTTVITGDNWCSIALMPTGDGGGIDTGEDTGTAPGDQVGAVSPPGTATSMETMAGCASGPQSPRWLWVLGAGLLIGGRRRR